MRVQGSVVLTLAVALVLAALCLVTWRQTRALERLAELDHLRNEISLMTAERNELQRRIQSLESRGHVVPTARDRLGLRTPTAGEIVLLPGPGLESAEAGVR